MCQFPDDVIEFLQQPGQIATLATIDAHGFPHLTTMWYLYDDSALWMWTWKTRIKYLNTRDHNEKVGVYIQAADDVHKGLTLKGTVRHHEEGLETRAEQIARRYVPEESVPLWIGHILYGQAVLLQITPVWFARNGSSWNL